VNDDTRSAPEVATMLAMVLRAPHTALVEQTRPLPQPGPGEVRLAVRACAVCRTDLHLACGELPMARLPVVPGHEIVGTVQAIGAGVADIAVGQRVGVPWLGGSCGRCDYCRRDRENLCDSPQFTGCTRDGGFATHCVADARFVLPLDAIALDDVAVAPLLCAGLIGWRSLRMAGDDAQALGLYGFGAAAHLVAQVARAEGRRVHAFTRAGDTAAQQLALGLGATWAGAADQAPPEPLDAAIIFAPAGELVPRALAAVRKGGRVVCGGIHMSDIPSFPYALLWHERQLVSVANLTRHDGREFVRRAPGFDLRVTTTTYPLERANDALGDLSTGRLHGAAVLVPKASRAPAR
jgi:propanol-preferring alcohol dehydrogenase